ncbi:MAG: GIY-YIG nuclease family protein [Candidatus Omnitrophica bacterium]|nr:GIY-YIG nuclease family protein [Candidatus Omnitrophota bacterium]
MKQKNWFVYIVECRDKRLYTGITNDVEKRVAAHNKGKGCRFTKFRYPVKLVYEEDCITRSAARKRELEIQGFKRNKKLSLINRAR